GGAPTCAWVVRTHRFLLATARRPATLESLRPGPGHMKGSPQVSCDRVPRVVTAPAQISADRVSHLDRMTANGPNSPFEPDRPTYPTRPPRRGGSVASVGSDRRQRGLPGVRGHQLHHLVLAEPLDHVRAVAIHGRHQPHRVAQHVDLVVEL